MLKRIVLLFVVLFLYSPSIFSQDIRTNRIIVKLKKRASASAVELKIKNSSLLSKKVSVASQSNDDLFVIELDSFKNQNQLNDVIDLIKKELDAEYAEPAKIAKPAYTIPNDEYYKFQWNIQSSTSYPSAINAMYAWDITRGSTSTVVAVVDTGILIHQDLPSSRILPGYDMISDLTVANDGNLRDNDPSDPGDWCSASERNNQNHICYDPGCAPKCSQISSSWHGLFVTGIISALTNNSSFVSGIDWNNKILPLRVLGKGGGYDSDIADAIIWAAGGNISGLPSNPNPARVINMSLAGPGSCGSYLQSAINYAISRGVVVVVAAGNENDNVSNYWPANCSGVIAVSATNKDGYRAPYSNYGSLVFISAPGGDNDDGHPIYSIVNGGDTVPLDSSFDTWGYYNGTSMAAPHVSGVISLMIGFKPSLSANDIRYNIQKTARAFPSGSTCNTSICGAGMLDAYSAVDNLIISVSSTTPSSAKNYSNISLSVWGKGFLSGASVRLKRSGYSDINCSGVNVVNLNRIDCTLPLTGAATGQWSVEVINPDFTSYTLSNYFTVTSFYINSITPSSGFNNMSSVAVTVSGSNFVSPVSLKLTRSGYSDINCSNVNIVDSNTLTCSFNLLGAFAGKRDLIVVNGDGKTYTVYDAFEIKNDTVTVSTISPTSSLNNTSVKIYVRGSGFYPSASARFYGSGYSDVNCVMNVYSSTYALCDADFNGAFSGKRSFEFTTSTDTLNLTNVFDVLNAPLYISSVKPSSVSNNQSSVVFYINGSGFTSSAGVKISKTGFADINPVGYTVHSSTFITATFNLSNVAAGKRDFVVYQATQSYTKNDALTIVDYLLPPVVYYINPASSFNNVNPVINIYGDNFISGLSLKIYNMSGEINISDFQLASSTAIVNAVLPLKGYPQGKWSVKVTNPDAKSYTLNDAFTLLEVKEDVKIYNPVLDPEKSSEIEIVYNIDDPQEVVVTVYDNMMNKIRELYRGVSSAGLSNISWDGKDNSGRNVRSGIYIIEIKTKQYKKYKRVLVVR